MVYCFAHLHFSVGRNSDALNRLKPITKRSSCRNFFHHKSYSFLSRTVRLTNSNPKALILGSFSFPKSLDFKPLQTKVQIMPWQMKSTRIIKISYHKKPRNAVFWGILPTCFFYYKSYILSADFAKYGKTVQFTPSFVVKS